MDSNEINSNDALTVLLAALVVQSDGELVVTQEAILSLAEDDRSLVIYPDTEKDAIVVTLGKEDPNA